MSFLYPLVYVPDVVYFVQPSFPVLVSGLQALNAVYEPETGLHIATFDTSPYVTAQMQNCYRQFLLDNQTFYEGDMIEKLLDTIQSSPRESSNPNDYIASHVKEFRRLTYFGAYVLEYYFRQFENSERIDEPGWGLREHIMARSCVEIAQSYGEMVINDDTVILDGQEWYQQFKQNAYALQGRYREEELKEKYYASWILLEFLAMYYGLYPYSET